MISIIAKRDEKGLFVFGINAIRHQIKGADDIKRFLVPTLRVLNLNDNLIKSFDSFKKLGDLEELDLSENLIQSLSGVESLSSLRKLNLSRNFIENFSALQDFGLDLGPFLVHLQELDLSGNLIQSIRGVESLPSLKKLNLSGNSIKSLSGLRALVNLEELDLSENKDYAFSLIEEKIPDSVKNLNLSHSKIEFIGSGLPLSLVKVDLTGCGIHSLNGAVFHNELEVLILQSNELFELDASLPDSLLELNLYGNLFESFCWDELPPNLQKLFLGKNLFNNIKGAKFPESLEWLSFSECYDIESLEGAIFPADLQILDLTCTDFVEIRLEDIPDGCQILGVESDSMEMDYS